MLTAAVLFYLLRHPLTSGDTVDLLLVTAVAADWMMVVGLIWVMWR